MSHRVRPLSRWVVVTAIALPGMLRAEETPAPVHVAADAACNGTLGAEAVARALRERMDPERVRLGPAPAGAAVVRWVPGPDGCVLELETGPTRAGLRLPAGSGEAAIADVASRLAWLIDDDAARTVAGGDAVVHAAPSNEGSGGAPEGPAGEPADSASPMGAEGETGSAEGSGAPETGEDATGAEVAAAPRPPIPYEPFGLSVLPDVNVPTSADIGARRGFSLTLLGSHTGGLEGVELGLVYNRETGDVRGLQVAQGANLVDGEVVGVQLATGANVVEGPVDAVQLAAGANVVDGDVRGLQGSAGANVVSGEVRGVQLTSGANVVQGDVRGLQAAPINVVGGTVIGVQPGVINVTGDVRGVQAGVINVAGDVRGLQLGVVNVARTSSASLGIINVFHGEPVYGLAWQDGDGTTRLGIQHGSRHFRQVYGVGFDLTGETRRWSAGLGFGTHVPLGRAYLELDGLGWVQGVWGEAPVVDFVRDDDREVSVRVDGIDYQAQARLTLGVSIWERVAVFGGAQLNALWSENPESDQPWSNATPDRIRNDDAPTGATWFYLWPSFHVGLRF